LTIVLMTSVIEAALPVGMVWVGKLVIDAVVAHDADALMWNIGVEAALTVALLVTQVGSGHALGLLHIRARFHGHMKLLERAARVPYVCFEDPAFYDAMNRALPEANGRPMAVVHHTIGVGSAGIGLLGATALLSGVSPWVGAAMIASSLPRFANERWFQRAWFHLRSARAPLHRELEYFETLLTKDDTAREIRLFGLADRFLSFGRALFERTWEQDRALSTRRTLLDLLTSTFSSVIFVGIHLYVGLAAVRGDLTVGDITLVLTAFRSGEGSISGLLQAAGLLYEDRLYLGHITTFEALSEPERTEGATVGPDPDDGLRFEHVTFRYPGAERDALSDLSLHLRAGEKIALVGVNGAGKSTLLKLTLGLYEPTAGRILYQGLPLTEWSPAALRRQMSALFQDFVRYQLSARQNVTLEEQATPEQLAVALELGLADPVVHSLPRGLDTRLGRWFDDGQELSGGQWQKIGLARAFFRADATLLLLDEPTAAMDPEAEVAMFRRLRERRPHRGVILVSHRFSAVRLTDRIVVIEDGRLIEQGDHDALLAANGRYAELFRIQAEGYQ